MTHPNRRRNAKTYSENSPVRWISVTTLMLMAALVTGCGKEEIQKAPLVPVEAITVEPQTIVVLDEFPGEVSSSQEVDLRARVSGILQQKHFVDGATVQKDQLLFTIDDRDLKSRLLEAEAVLTAAQSNYTRAKLDVDRYESLIGIQAIARQVYDNAVATLNSARSEVENAKAAVEQAKLGVEYASITSPVSGRIGAADVEVGDLISAGSTLLAKVSSVDKSWVYFSVSEPKLLSYEHSHGTIDVNSGDDIPVKMFLSNGVEYPFPGQINFSDRALNPSTGTFRLRVEFPNPKGVLRPGMFARIQVSTDERKDVIAIPDKAVSQLLNTYSVTVVDDGNVARQVPVKVGPRQNGLWIIEDGLKAGDVIVVEGIQRARNGAHLVVKNITDNTSNNTL